jgi:hypothetical protein
LRAGDAFVVAAEGAGGVRAVVVVDALDAGVDGGVACGFASVAELAEGAVRVPHAIGVLAAFDASFAELAGGEAGAALLAGKEAAIGVFVADVAGASFGARWNALGPRSVADAFGVTEAKNAQAGRQRTDASQACFAGAIVVAFASVADEAGV